MSRLRVILCGFITGSVMAVPGISGGSAAMVIGVYDDLLRAVSRCFSEPRRNIPLLLRFALGGILGLFLMAGAISWLLTTPAEVPVRFLFLGAVAGGIPAIFRKAGVRRLNASGLVLILSGAAAVLLLASFPEGLFTPGERGFADMALQFTGGVLLAAALVLPGISASHFLYMLGIYDAVMEKLSTLDLIPLLPLAAGTVLGIFLTARLIETLFQRHQAGTFLVILGFMLASLRELIPRGAEPWQILTGIPCILVGFVPVYFIQSDGKNAKPARNRE
jgi:putative membrane protein